MPAPLLTLRDVHLNFGGTPLLDGVDLAVNEAERLCVVGRNGSGKSTLLKIAAGIVEPDRGERTVRQGATIRYLPQEPDFSGYDSVLAFAEADLAPGDDPHRAKLVLDALGLTGTESPDRLSGGEARRAALARVIAPDPDILLLDEPTNHLDLPAIEWLENELLRRKSALVLVSHDRRFLEKLSRATVWLDRGQARRLDQGFASFEAWRDTLLEQEERDREKLDRSIEAELSWMRYGVTARRKRNQRRVRALAAMRQERREQRRSAGAVSMSAVEADVSGKLVIEAVGISKCFGETVVVRDFSIRIARGDRVGIVGPNGAGKTTLVNLLTGVTAPDKGIIRIGANVRVVSLDQRRDSLDPNRTLAETLTGDGDSVWLGGRKRHVVSYMKDFLFAPEQARTQAGMLSGGERGRLMIARALAAPSNLLVLDEPTNDLDLETLDVLQEMLADYPGTVLVVSHDRDFLDRTVTSVLMSDGGGRWTEYAGGYSDMVAQRGGGVTAKRAVAQPTAKATSSPAARPAPKQKLSFSEKHALETLPSRIEALQAEIARLQGELADSNLFRRDTAAFERAAAALARTEADLREAEDRWLALAILRDELEG